MRRIWKPRGDRKGARARARLASLLDKIPHDEPEWRLQFLLFHIVADSGREHAELLASARGLGLDVPTSDSLLRYEVPPDLRPHELAEVLRSWKADKSAVDLALDLLVHMRRQSLSPPSAEPTAALPGPAAVPEPSAGAGKPEPSTAGDAAELMALMRAYRVWKGKPPYRRMAERIGNAYAISTLSIAAKGPRLPNLSLYLAFLKGCGADEEDLAIWKKVWQEIAVRENNSRNDN